jgi:hypothetical protein
MTWVKRNLPFVVAGAVALLLLGVAGFFLFSNYSEERQISEELATQTDALQQLVNQPVHPGTDKVNNIEAAKQETKRWEEGFLTAAKSFFTSLSTNDQPDVGSFQLRLASTIAELQQGATNASVIIPPQYAFSFETQLRTLQTDSGALESLGIQLDDVRNFAEILFRSKVHRLISIQRVSVSSNELASSRDFLPKTIYSVTTNDVVGAAVFPYRFTFVSHSAEMARVVSELARSKEGYVIKYLSVQPYVADTEGEDGLAGPGEGRAGEAGGFSADLARRYGLGGARPGGGMSPDLARRYGMGGGGSRYGGSRYGGGRPGGPMMPMPPMMQQAPGMLPPPQPTGVILKEGPLQISVLVESVRLLPEDRRAAARARKPAPPAETPDPNALPAGDQSVIQADPSAYAAE